MKSIFTLLLTFAAPFAFADSKNYDCVSHNHFTFHELVVVDGFPDSLDGQPLPRYYDFDVDMGVNRDGLMLYFIDGITGLDTHEFYCKPKP